MAWLVIGCLLASFCLSYFGVAAMRRLAPRWGLIDQPAARKVHRVPTPLGGGVGVWFGVCLPVTIVLGLAAAVQSGRISPAVVPELFLRNAPGIVSSTFSIAVLMGGATVLAVVGLIDDFRGLSWKLRLGVQFAVAALLISCGIRLSLFVAAPWVGMIVTAAWLAVLVNAFNFLDNMNGLSGGVAMVSAGLLAFVMLVQTPTPHWFVAGLALLLSGALGGFLIHNWRGKIFLGDAGSYFLGTLLASLTIVATFYEPRVGGRQVVLVPLCLLAVPLYDFTSVIVIRLSQGRSPFQPDKCHFSHRLVALGLSPAQAVCTIYLATFTTGVAGLLLYEVSGWNGAWLVLTLVVGVLAMVAVLEVAGSRSLRSRGPESAGVVSPVSPSPLPRVADVVTDP